ncbi:MAG: enoyl-CoA hydratase/isomerase [Caulobacter sp.]|nr:enoyl-CoA hydratase/isomerase [Caulobacter sp.]
MSDVVEAPGPELLVSREDHILVLTLNRPAQLNAVSRTLQEALERTLLEADADPSVRVIVITGAGRGFCSGGDMGSLNAGASKSVEEQLAVPEPKWTARMAKVYKPTIVAVNGVCAGAGLHFVVDCDIVIASEAASFLDTHVNVGQVTALEPIGLIRKVPMGTVLRMVILGKAERLSARQALAAGLISEVLPAEELMPRAMALARIAAAVSPASVRQSLRLIWESLELPLSEAYTRGLEALIRHRDHPDALEGTTAFIEKRDPVWTA